jgi:hypothetical protein
MLTSLFAAKSLFFLLASVCLLVRTMCLAATHRDLFLGAISGVPGASPFNRPSLSSQERPACFRSWAEKEHCSYRKNSPALTPSPWGFPSAPGAVLVERPWAPQPASGVRYFSSKACLPLTQALNHGTGAMSGEACGCVNNNNSFVMHFSI